MKSLSALLATTLLASLAFAGPTPEQIDKAGMEILIQNSGKLVSEEGQKVSTVLAETLVSHQGTTNKITNTCNFDKDDSVFKCRMQILNSDIKKEGRTESSTEIWYELEKSSSGLPSNDLFMLTVQIVRAG